MRISISKIAALLIATGYVVALVVVQGGFTYTAVRLCLMLAFVLALIWFPEEIGGFTGYTMRLHVVDAESPPSLISFLGWFFLVGLPLLIYWFSR